MNINLAEDIRSITDLKRHARDILAHAHHTRRPVVLTVNGRADAVLIDAKAYEEQQKAAGLMRALLTAEQEIRSQGARPLRSFLRKFKDVRQIPR